MHGLKKEPRRNAPRINVRSNQIAYLNFHSGNGGIVLDVSTNGLGFQAVDPVKIDELVPFRLSVPGFPLINLFGLVTWVDESRKRGGLRVTVPEAERPAFQLWQQYLAPQPETALPVSRLNGADIASEGQLEPKRFRVSRNVLVASLLVVLCVALGDGSQFVATAHRIGSLLWHVGRTQSSAVAQAAPTALLQASSMAKTGQGAGVSSRADRRATHIERPGHHDAQLAAPAAAAGRGSTLQSGAVSIGAAQTSATNAVSEEPAPGLMAKSSGAGRVVREQSRGPNFPRLVSTAQPTQPEPRTLRRAPVLATSTATPAAPGLVAASSPAAPPQTEMIKSSLPAPASAGTSSQEPDPEPSIEPCQLVSSVQPAYPKEARKQRVQGDVKLRIVVGTDGTVKDVSAVDGPSLLIAAAVNATRQFHYKPAMLNGKAIETIQTVDIAFKLAR